LPIVALGLIGFVIARQLTAYQLGHVDGVWEPFFHGEAGRNGTETIITSDVSKAWPIADAGLGAVSYMFEVLMGVMGDRRRWRTMPWMVMAFGIVVVPLGVVSIYFIIIQPIVIGTFINVGFGLWLVAAPWLLDGGRRWPRRPVSWSASPSLRSACRAASAAPSTTAAGIGGCCSRGDVSGSR
jgi:hypothetical protein